MCKKYMPSIKKVHHLFQDLTSDENKTIKVDCRTKEKEIEILLRGHRPRDPNKEGLSKTHFRKPDTQSFEPSIELSLS